MIKPRKYCFLNNGSCQGLKKAGGCQGLKKQVNNGEKNRSRQVRD
jgi:hypothetical protein